MAHSIRVLGSQGRKSGGNGAFKNDDVEEKVAGWLGLFPWCLNLGRVLFDVLASLELEWLHGGDLD